MAEEEQSSGLITKVSSMILDLPPSCIEFSPLEPEYFVVGTYNLQKEDNDTALPSHELEDDGNYKETSVPADEAEGSKKQQSRTGSLILYKIVDEQVSLVQTLSYPSAILDLHFSPHEPSTFAIASSTGSFSFYSLNKDDPGDLDKSLSIVHLGTSQLFAPDKIITSFAFHPHMTNPLQRGLIAVTLSDGNIHLVKRSDQSWTNLTILSSSPIITHTLEAWCVAFSTECFKGRTIYSGGDDGVLRWATLEDASCASEAIIERHSHPRGMSGHDAGVTAILPLPITYLDLHVNTGLLLTGSYDDHVRVLQIDSSGNNKSRSPKVHASLYIGGGVWRLRLLGTRSREDPDYVVSGRSTLIFTILASCMHEGVRILEVSGQVQWNPGPHSDNIYEPPTWGSWDIKVLDSFKEHKSMNYGSDVQPTRPNHDDGKGLLCVSTSFYDHLLCVWRFKERERHERSLESSSSDV